MAGARDVSIRISAQDLTSGVVGQIRGQFVQMVSAFASGELIVDGLRSAFHGLVSVIEHSINAAADAERVQAQFQRGLRNAGITTQAAIGSADDYATSLSYVTNAEDDAIKTGMTLLASLGRVRGEGLERASKAALDLSAHTGKELSASFEALAKFAAGNETALAKMGIKIDDTIPKGERFKAVLDLIAERMGGAAEAEAGTLYGRIHNVRKAIGELSESMGRFVTSGEAKGFLGWMTDILNTSSRGLDAARLSSITNAARDRVLALASPYAQGMASRGADLQGFIDNEQQILDLIKQLQEIGKSSTLSPEQVGEQLLGAVDEQSAQRTILTLKVLRDVFQVSVDLAKQQASDADAKAKQEQQEQDAAAALERQNKALKEREQLVQRLAALAAGPTNENLIAETFRLASTVGTPETDAIMGPILAAADQLSVEQLARALKPLHDRLQEAWRQLQEQKKTDAAAEIAQFGEPPVGQPIQPYSPTPDNPLSNPQMVESIATMLERARNEAEDLTGILGNSLVGAADAFGTAVANSLVYLQDFGDAAKAIFKSLIAQIVAAIVRMLALRALFAMFGGGLPGGGEFYGALFGAQGGGVVPHAAYGLQISPGMMGLRSARIAGQTSLDVVPALLAPGEQVLSAGEAERYRSGRGDAGAGLSVALAGITTRRVYRDFVQNANDFVRRRGGRLVASEVRR